MRVGYIASHYPAISHAFVVREVMALRRLGVEVETFSIRRTPAAQLLSARDRAEAARTYAVVPPAPADLVLAHLTALALGPGRYLATLREAMRIGRPGLRGRLYALYYFGEAMMVWRAARRRGVRHLHAQFADVATDVALLVAHYGGAGWSWSLAVHGPVEFYDVTLNRLREKLDRARFATAISDFGRSQLMTLMDEARWDDLHVVRCGIEPAVFATDGHPPRPAGAHRVLCVGRLVRLKGQRLLIEAIAELVRRGRDVELTLVGDGPTRPGLERLARDLGLAERVTFAGAVGQDDIVRYYAQADVFCLPSNAEGLPVVLMEAMAQAIPVVTTRIMGIPELVEHELTGLLVTPGRHDELVASLDRLLGDAALRARLGRAGRERVIEQFDVDASARRLHDVFDRAIPAA